MTAIKTHLSSIELEARYETAVDPIAKSHFHAVWLLSCGYDVEEVAELLSFSTRWVWALVKRYNEGGRTRSVINASTTAKADNPHGRGVGRAQRADQDAA